jgi:hypothetical protein
MKTKLILTLVLIGVFGIEVKGCDVCGGGMGANFPGLFTQLKTNYMGLTYMNSRTSTFHPPDLDDPYKKRKTKENYVGLTILGQMNFTEKWQGLIMIPYKMNRRTGAYSRLENNGMGDVTIGMNYRLIDYSDSAKLMKHFFQVGGGLDIPTGKFKNYDYDENVSPALQLTTGGLNYYFSATYRMRFNSWGWSLNSKYKRFSSNPDDYKMGDNLNMKMMSFYWKSFKKWTSVMEVNYSVDKSMKNTNGSRVIKGSERTVQSVGLEFNAFIKRVIIGVGAQVPVLQNVEDEKVTVGNLFTTKFLITI